MAIKGPSLKKEVSTAAVINYDPHALSNSYAYSVKKAEVGTGYVASVVELLTPEKKFAASDAALVRKATKAK